MVKRAYVLVVRSLRTFLAKVGLLAFLDRWARRSATGAWVRSWLAIYDLDDLRRLDLPWWTLDAADDVAQFLCNRERARVFEWGSGASTFWLARRAGSVTSVEHDRVWAESMLGNLPANATLRAVPPTVPNRGEQVAAGSRKAGFAGLDFADYVAAIDEVVGRFDLIVIDGRAREACLPKAVDRLAPDGLIVFDNVERRRYRDALDGFGDRLHVRSPWGRTACLPYPTRTALARLSSPGR